MKSLRNKIRICYLCLIALLILAGLLSRKASFLPGCIGDALWAIAVFCCWRIILIDKRRLICAAAALVTSFAVEFSQLLTPEWLVKLRSTFIGHMLLGQGFLWSDLAAYTVGIAVIFTITSLIGRRFENR